MRSPSHSSRQRQQYAARVARRSHAKRRAAFRTCKNPGGTGGFVCARYWDRTSDLFRVREARYRCANRARWGYSVTERWRRDSNPCKRLCRPVPSRSATPPCGLTPRAEGLPKKVPALERMTRLELATPTLARLCATNCATSALFPVVVPGTYETLADDRRLSKPKPNLARVSQGGQLGLRRSGSIG